MSLYLYSASHVGCIHALRLTYAPGIKHTENTDSFLYTILKKSWSSGNRLLCVIFSIWLLHYYSPTLLHNAPLSHPVYLHSVIPLLQNNPLIQRINLCLSPKIKDISIVGLLLLFQLTAFILLKLFLKLIGQLLNRSKDHELSLRNQQTLWHLLCTGFIAHQVTSLWGLSLPSLLYLSYGFLHTLHTFLLPPFAKKHGNFFYFLSAFCLDYYSAFILFHHPFSFFSKDIALALYLNSFANLLISLVYFLSAPPSHVEAHTPSRTSYNTGGTRDFSPIEQTNSCKNV